MKSLLVEDPTVPGGLRPNKNLMAPNADEASDEAPGHYRRITYEAWSQLVLLYGTDGPAIAVVRFTILIILPTSIPLLFLILNLLYSVEFLLMIFQDGDFLKIQQILI